jgi:hypothetical protein
MKDEIYPVFLNILMVCSELNLIGGEMFAIDGWRISARLYDVLRPVRVGALFASHAAYGL